MTRNVYILSGSRTAIGTFGGSLSGFSPRQLAAICFKDALHRSTIEPEAVGHSVFGNVIPTGPEDAFLGRVAAVDSGVPWTTPGLTVNRLCGSGVQAIISAAQYIMLGECETAVAGGAETMSQAPHIVKSGRFGKKMGDIGMIDALTGVLHGPFGEGIMGVTAERVAERYNISREDQDAFALQSQQRAQAAIANGHFTSQIVPVGVKVKGAIQQFSVDEHPKSGTTMEKLAALPTSFKAGGTVTPGNASGINDGAAAVVLASGDEINRRKVKPLARIIAYAHSGVDPAVMGIGPVSAVQSLLEKTGLALDDFDVIESNEAFASQAVAVTRELGADPAKVNPDGGAIALGHPVGATGAILTVKAINYLQRTSGRRAIVTMCIGGGQGIALGLERC